ncbi:MAG: cyclic nucleotide-binding domain-containing protein, partial [Cyanothece sp. SIO1E1]|nr:cyclic nucleotide-binding domain-containing protein [Cyanothece sp. SIO1E1]
MSGEELSVNLVTWLQERTALSSLSRDILEVIAPLLNRQVIAANQRLIVTQTSPKGLYILQSGQIETTSSSWAVSLLPGAVINLRELLLKQPVQNTLVTLSTCVFWVLSTEAFEALIAQNPEITRAFSQKLAEEVEQLSSQINFQQERQQILRPYLVTKAKRGVIGKSRYAIRLRSQIRQAFNQCQSVLIFGEPGLEKDTIAALIHFGSSHRREPMIQVDCASLQASGAELWGRAGGKPGLIEVLGRGTLVLNNIQEL